MVSNDRTAVSCEMKSMWEEAVFETEYYPNILTGRREKNHKSIRSI